MATGNAKARATLKYSPESYTPYNLHEWPLRDLRKEYTRLRDIAQKRIKRLRADPEGAQSRVLEIFPDGIPKISDMHGSRQALQNAMADLALFIRSPESTVSGVRAANRSRARAMGMAGEQTAQTYMSLQEWFAYCRARGILELFGSDEARAYYYEASGLNVTESDYRKWAEDREEWEARRYDNEPEEGSDSDSMRREISRFPLF